MGQYQTAILPNGLKIIHQHVANRVAYCGLIIGAGSRDERSDEQGVAHFIEHVIFKGTEKRRACHIMTRMEDVGGELNAYTTKEDTCLYATFLAKDYGRALELLSDLLINSIFPEREIEKEKDVVIDEINSYKDSPCEAIVDDFEGMLFKGYPIGRNILGTEESVRNLTREQIMDFVHRNYKPQRIVVSSVGDIDFGKLLRLVERYFGGMSGDSDTLKREAPLKYTPETLTLDKETYQNHCMIGNRAYDHSSDDRLAFSMLVEMLGGTGLNSRLNMNVREKYGLVYDIEANYTPYSDTGMFGIYFGCDEEDTETCLRLCRKEMEYFCEKPLSSGRLKRVQNQIIGQLEVSSENYENQMLSLGKSFLIYDRVDELDDICKRIAEVTAEDLRRIACEIFDPEKLSTLIYG